MFKSPLFWSDHRYGRPKSKKRRRKYGHRWFWKPVVVLILVTVLVPLALRWMPPPTSAFMLKSLFTQPTFRYRWVPSKRISRHLPVAVVAAEDQKFPQHWGFDFNAISSAIKENKRRKRVRGASTITQQVAKNLFLWSGRSYTRKGLEAYFTVMIELLWPKQRILEIYLNIAEFGPGIFGVEAASQAYFNKSANRLYKSEAALLAAVLPSPHKLKVADPSDYVRERARQIQTQMSQLGGSAHLRGIWPTR